MSTAPYRGFAPPAGDAPPAYDVVGIDGTGFYDFTFLDERMLGLRTHWVWDKATKKGRSRLCFAFEGECPYCEHFAISWVGFIAVLNNEKPIRQVARFGPEGARILSRHATKIDGLRGRRLLICRSSGLGERGIIVKQTETPARLPLPQAHGIDRSVCMVLGCAAIPDFRFSVGELADGHLAPEEGGGL